MFFRKRIEELEKKVEELSVIGTVRYCLQIYSGEKLYYWANFKKKDIVDQVGNNYKIRYESGLGTKERWFKEKDIVWYHDRERIAKEKRKIEKRTKNKLALYQ